MATNEIRTTIVVIMIMITLGFTEANYKSFVCTNGAKQ